MPDRTLGIELSAHDRHGISVRFSWRPSRVFFANFAVNPSHLRKLLTAEIAEKCRKGRDDKL
jgi:hypothetical protein